MSKKKAKLPLSKTHPKLAKEAVDWDPETVNASSASKVKWVCKKGHEWEAAIYSRVSGNGCPYCSNQRILIGYNDLAFTNPEFAKEAYGWDPKTVTVGSNKKVKWRCSLNHVYVTQPHRRTKGLGCPYCSGQAVWPGFNDLATTHPELSEQLVDGDATTISKGYNKVYTWKCKLGHTWRASVNSRTSNNGNCIFCYGKAVWPGFNDLATTHPELAEQLVDGDATTISRGQTKYFTWKCKLGHTWRSTVNNRVSGFNCPYCTSHTVLYGFNDLETKNPELAKEAYGWDPKTIMEGSSKKLKWICNKGHTWGATVSARSAGYHTGCPSCAKHGFDPNSDGYFYFLIHEDWEMFQIGITNVPDERLTRHVRSGWKVLELRGPIDGQLTQQWETAILRMLKAKGADLSNSKIAGKFDGYSEAWSKSKFPVKSIKELMRLTEEFEESNK